MQASVFRAVENRVFVVRVANTGFSCIIDDKGKVLEKVQVLNGKETFVTGVQTGMVYKSGHHSLYTKIGDVFVVACGVILALVMLKRRRKV
jgi:apolipoprotein N-acyltransferase